MVIMIALLALVHTVRMCVHAVCCIAFLAPETACLVPACAVATADARHPQSTCRQDCVQGYFFKAGSLDPPILSIHDVAKVTLQAHAAQTFGLRCLIFFPVSVRRPEATFFFTC